jgi:PAS domain S-box-containing protein
MDTPLLETPEPVIAYRKRIVRALRFLLVLAMVGVAYPVSQLTELPWLFWLAAGLFLASNVAFHLDSVDLFRQTRVSSMLFLFDVVLIGFMLALAGERTSEFYVMFALTILLAAACRRVALAFLVTAAVSGLYATLTLSGKTGVPFLSPEFMTRIALLFVVAMFVGFLSQEVQRARTTPRVGIELFRGLLNLNPVYVFLCDLDMQILQVNIAVETDLGYTAEELQGRPIRRVAKLPEDFRVLLNAAPLTSPDGGAEAHLTRKDESVLPVRARGAVIGSPSGPLRLIIAQGNAPRAAAEEPTQEKLEILAELGGALPPEFMREMFDRFSSIIRSCRRLAQSAGSPDQRARVRSIWRSALSVSHLVQNFLIYAPRLDPKPAILSLNEEVEEILALAAGDLKAGGIKVDWQPDPEIPSVVADPQQIEQVVLNLLDNARRAIEGTSSYGYIRVRTRSRGGSVHLDVLYNRTKPTGDAASRMFQPFARSGGKTSWTGLNVSRAFIKAHGGSFTIEEEMEGTTTLRVSLPAAPPVYEALARAGRRDPAMPLAPEDAADAERETTAAGSRASISIV